MEPNQNNQEESDTEKDTQVAHIGSQAGELNQAPSTTQQRTGSTVGAFQGSAADNNAPASCRASQTTTVTAIPSKGLAHNNPPSGSTTRRSQQSQLPPTNAVHLSTNRGLAKNRPPSVTDDHNPDLEQCQEARPSIIIGASITNRGLSKNRPPSVISDQFIRPGLQKDQEQRPSTLGRASITNRGLAKNRPPFITSKQCRGSGLQQDQEPSPSSTSRASSTNRGLSKNRPSSFALEDDLTSGSVFHSRQPAEESVPSSSSMVSHQNPPGAFSVETQNGNPTVQQQHLTSMTGNAIAEAPTSVGHDQFHDSILAPNAAISQAIPVVERDLEEAEAVDSSELKHRQARQCNREKSYCVCGLVLAGVVVLAIGLRTQAALTSNITTSIPTTSPTQAPTKLSFEDHFMALLPSSTTELIAEDPFSEEFAQSKAFQWLLADPYKVKYSDERLVQRFALATFYFATGGDTSGWHNDTNWLSYDHSECDWFMARYRRGGSVASVIARQHPNGTFSDEIYKAPEAPCCSWTGNGDPSEEKYLHLWLSRSGLKGSIPEEFYLLTSLRSIYLSGNDLTGSISTNMGYLTNLEVIALTGNKFRGSLPLQVGALRNLTVMTASNNAITGSLPQELGELPFTHLWLEQNYLSGSIPSSFGLMSRLESLFLFENDLTGPLPSTLSLMSSLKEIYLKTNLLTGKIPELATLTMLSALSLDDNRLTGPIPDLSPSLQFLYLQDNGFTGSISTTVGLLKNLEDLWLNDNALTGIIPSEMGSLESLRYSLYLYSNNLTGPLPTTLGMLTIVRDVQLDSNNFSSRIPSEIGAMASVDRFLAYDNSLSGWLPSELGTWSDLIVFNVGDNRLSGSIPRFSAANASLMHRFNISGNLFSGVVPEGLCIAGPSVLYFDCSMRLCGCWCNCSTFQGSN